VPTSRRIAIPIQVLTLLALWSILALTGCDKASAPGQIAMLRLRAGSPPRYDVVVSATDGSASRLLTGDSVRGGLEPVLFGRGSWAPDDRHLALAVDLTRSHGRIAPSDVYVLDTRTGRFYQSRWLGCQGVVKLFRNEEGVHFHQRLAIATYRRPDRGDLVAIFPVPTRREEGQDGRLCVSNVASLAARTRIPSPRCRPKRLALPAVGHP